MASSFQRLFVNLTNHIADGDFGNLVFFLGVPPGEQKAIKKEKRLLFEWMCRQPHPDDASRFMVTEADVSYLKSIFRHDVTGVSIPPCVALVDAYERAPRAPRPAVPAAVAPAPVVGSLRLARLDLALPGHLSPTLVKRVIACLLHTTGDFQAPLWSYLGRMIMKDDFRSAECKFPMNNAFSLQRWIEHMQDKYTLALLHRDLGDAGFADDADLLAGEMHRA